MLPFFLYVTLPFEKVQREQEKHEQYGKKIAQLEEDIEKLDDFVLKYEKTINTFEPYEVCVSIIVGKWCSFTKNWK